MARAYCAGICALALAIGCGKGSGSDDENAKNATKNPTQLVAASIGAVYALDGRYPTALAVRDQALYWIEKGSIMAGSVGGGQPRVLTRYRGFAPRAQLAVDATHLYWTDGGAIYRIARAGGDAVRVAARHAAVALTIDDNHIYYASKTRGDGGTQLALWRFAKTAAHGRDASRVDAALPAGRAAPALVVRDNNLYCACSSRVIAIDLSSGAVRELVSGGRYTRLAVSGDAIFYADEARQLVGRVPRAASGKARVVRRGAITGLAFAGRTLFLSERERISKISP